MNLTSAAERGDVSVGAILVSARILAHAEKGKHKVCPYSDIRR